MKKLLIIAICFSWVQQLWSQTIEKNKLWIGFYNLENLYDTIDNENVDDSPRTPRGTYRWTQKRLEHKLSNLNTVIHSIAKKVEDADWLVLGVCEVENLGVLERLREGNSLLNNSKIIHFDSKDLRGIDVALFYNPLRFRPIHFTKKSIPLSNAVGEPIFTRDLLIVTGLLNTSERIHFIVAHWPSRSGGQRRSASRRYTASYHTRFAVDSILKEDAQAKIIVMGDFNDGPKDDSMTRLLVSKRNSTKLINITEPIEKKGIGSLAHKDKWHLFDQFIVTPNLLGDIGLIVRQVGVLNNEFLRSKKGRFRGYPFRTYGGTAYQGGYSDHFPIFTTLGPLPPRNTAQDENQTNSVE